MADIKLYVADLSSSREIKTRQQQAQLILNGKNIPFEKIDISEDKELRTRMRELCDNPTALPPQLFYRDYYLGDFESLVDANEDGALMTFLRVTDPPSPAGGATRNIVNGNTVSSRANNCSNNIPSGPQAYNMNNPSEPQAYNTNNPSEPQAYNTNNPSEPQAYNTNNLSEPQAYNNTNNPSEPQAYNNTNNPSEPQAYNNTNNPSEPQAYNNTNNPSEPQAYNNTNNPSEPQAYNTNNPSEPQTVPVYVTTQQTSPLDVTDDVTQFQNDVTNDSESFPPQKTYVSSATFTLSSP